jgi:tetratricopeptide (TPR) repeat protein
VNRARGEPWGTVTPGGLARTSLPQRLYRHKIAVILTEVKVVSTTLTGSNADIIGDALRSVADWVDVCLIIDTGVGDDTLQVAQSVAGAKCVVRRFQWIQDFAAARNFALDAAHELGGDWAITLDTDERIQPNGEDLRELMARASEGVLMLYDERRSYAKERCFRLPASVRFEGPTHECYAAYRVGSRTLARATFRELGKPPAALRRKFERDVEILTRHTRANPKDPRWFYYLGDSLKNLGRLSEAIPAYDACAALRGWNEESAWACYRAAECLCTLRRFREAIERCALGLTRHAGIAELAWLAGFAAFQLKDHAQAVYWARLAITHGLFEGDGASVPRIGFRNLSALYEGPYDILRFAARQIGDTAGADAAEAAYQRASAARNARR